MAESLLVKIDLRQLQHNLTAAGDPVTEAETVEFLLKSGFVRNSLAKARSSAAVVSFLAMSHL